MSKLILIILLAIGLPFMSMAQQVTYSNYDQEDSYDINFEIIGKMKDNFLVYKNVRWRHKINIFDNDMKIKETIHLDFMPEKTFNVDFITYPDFFYMIYQYQRKNILHCMAIKMDGEGRKLTAPIELDTTQVGVFTDNKIYSAITSENKQKIMIFKLHKKNENFNIVTLLFNNNLKLLSKTRQSLPFDERKDNYNNFSLDNDGNFIFTRDSKLNINDDRNVLDLIIKAPTNDSFIANAIDLKKYFVDEIKLKIDNINKHYIINSFYFKKSGGNIIGLFTSVFDKGNSAIFTNNFIEISDSLREACNTNIQLRSALDDYFIRQIYIKKDGGFLITAEDFSSQTSNSNPWNRNSYLGNGFYSPYSYYSNPYSSYYRPYNSFNAQSTRYFYSNILVLSIDKNGNQEWGRVIQKKQEDDNNDNFLSFSTMNSGGQINFLFNNDKNRNQIIANQGLSPDGTVTRNPTLKSQERGYEFMTRLSKQVAASELIIPCAYRNYICFAKVDF